MSESMGYLQKIVNGLRERQYTLPINIRSNICPLNILKGDKRDTVMFTREVNLGNMFVIQSCCGFCLIHKSGNGRTVLCPLHWQNLESHFAVESLVNSQIDSPHTTTADIFCDTKMSKLGARGEHSAS